MIKKNCIEFYIRYTEGRLFHFKQDTLEGLICVISE
jgi:hypothetical protein